MERKDLHEDSGGNIETRIAKIESEHLDGVILAAAGLNRGGLKDKIDYYFSLEEMLPAPAQGILAVEIRDNAPHIHGMLQSIYDEEATLQMRAERSFLDTLQGGCHMPIGAYCKVEGKTLTLTGLYGDEEGRCLIRKTLRGKKEEANALGIELAEEVKGIFENENR